MTKKKILLGFFISIATLSIATGPTVSAVSQNQLQSIIMNTPWYDPNLKSCGSNSGLQTASSSSISSGGSVYIVGDSITERSESAYVSTFQSHGVTANVDAQAGRGLDTPGLDGTHTTGLQAIGQDANEIKAASAVVIALGTNGGDTVANIQQAISDVKNANSSAPIFWVDLISVGRTDNYNQTVIGPGNQAIYGQASSLGYSVISWFNTVDPNGNAQQPTPQEQDPNNYIDNSDGLGVHPTPAGITALVNLVVSKTLGNNGITTTSSSGSCCATTTALTGNGNGVEAFNYFIQKGLSPAAAAGIVGNLTEESIGVDPERLQGDYTGEHPAESASVQAVVNNGSVGWGIAQWTPPNKIITSSAQNGTPLPTIDTLSFQLDFLWNELNTSYQSVLAQLKTVTDPQVAATDFLTGFERGNPSPSRQAYALAYYNLSVNGTPLPPSVPVSYNNGASTGSAGGSTLASASGCSVASSSGYMNPYRGLANAEPMRIDEGVDYGGNGPIYALGPGKVVLVDNGTSSWPGGDYVTYQLTSGAYSGLYVYVAENCTPQVSVGQTVSSSTVICNTTLNYPFTESGWSYSPSYTDTPLAFCAYQQVPDGTAMAYGYNFNQLIVSLGAQSGTFQFSNQAGGQNLGGSLPNGWPSSQAAQQASNQFQC